MDEKQKIQGTIRKMADTNSEHRPLKKAVLKAFGLTTVKPISVNLNKCYSYNMSYLSKIFIKLMIHNKVRFFE